MGRPARPARRARIGGDDRVRRSAPGRRALRPLPVRRLLRRAELHRGPAGRAFEAGVFELPVLTTPVGSIPDLVVDGRNGLLVAPGDRAALVAALIRMAREPDGRARMGRQLQKDVQAFHP